jgi:hypothetical protein
VLQPPAERPRIRRVQGQVVLRASTALPRASTALPRAR